MECRAGKTKWNNPEIECFGTVNCLNVYIIYWRSVSPPVIQIAKHKSAEKYVNQTASRTASLGDIEDQCNYNVPFQIWASLKVPAQRARDSLTSPPLRRIEEITRKNLYNVGKNAAKQTSR